MVSDPVYTLRLHATPFTRCFAATINQLKGKVTMLFITHALPKNLLVEEVVKIGVGALSAVGAASAVQAIN